jgi:gamma-glutamylcyclotransferase (GGCT)/AIG2-like uncharacterized protein YtfP
MAKVLCKNKECTQGNFGKRKRFEQVRGEQVCCIECSLAVIRSKTYSRKYEKEIRLNNAIEKKKILEKLETHSDWLKKLQKVFNTYIRHRDKDKQCISCKTPLNGRKYDAGHFFSVGAYPNLRFDEDNVHGQCVHCNQHKHGAISEYAIYLPIRIGIEKFESLKNRRAQPLKLSIPDIKEMIDYYKLKVKTLKSTLI